MDEPVTVTYSVTARDAVRWNRELALPSFRFWGVARLLMTLALIWVVGLQVQSDGWPGAWLYVAAAALAVVALFVTSPVGNWYAVRKLERQYASVLGRPITLTVGDDGVGIASGHSSRLVGWPDIAGIQVYPEFLLIRGNVQPLVIIPVHALPSPATAEALVEVVRQRASGTPV